VKVSVCAACRTDIHIVEGDLALHKMPVIPGHQIIGRVDETGDGVTRLRLGQRIGVAWLRPVDGTCQFCRRGRENLCRDSRYTGYDADGGYAEYAVVPKDFAYELPEGLDDEHVSPLLYGGLIGYRALQRAAVPEKGRLLLVGFGRSAHIVIQIALHRGHEVSVVTRGENHIRQARELGAAWAGSDFRGLPGKADGAVRFAPSGKLVPPTLEALDSGVACSIAGIHLSDVPSLDYGRHLYQERELRSVTANTREDARALLAEAAEARVQPPTTAYALADANRALRDMKHTTHILSAEDSLKGVREARPVGKISKPNPPPGRACPIFTRSKLCAGKRIKPIKVLICRCYPSRGDNRLSIGTKARASTRCAREPGDLLTVHTGSRLRTSTLMWLMFS
jgi:alcohol dehydrogenase, propanol-preferring